LLGLQVAFTGVYEILEHGAPAPRNAQCFIDTPTKVFSRV